MNTRTSNILDRISTALAFLGCILLFVLDNPVIGSLIVILGLSIDNHRLGRLLKFAEWHATLPPERVDTETNWYVIESGVPRRVPQDQWLALASLSQKPRQ